MTLLPALLLALWTRALPNYQLTIDPAYLEALYQNPETEELFPAHISCPAGESDCLAGFRGTTSVHLPKKSWRLDLFDPGLAGRGRINLDAHYRDLTMMRNHLAMELVRRLGYPAPETRHVTLSINGENMGVYLETERVDGDFLLRNGLPGGVLFKAVTGAARFAPYLSGHPGTDGFSWRSGDETMLPLLARFIAAACHHSDFHQVMDTGMFLANMAADLAIMETDGPCKNFYLHLGADGIWRYFPWDHDSSFGNDWQGVFHGDLVDHVYTGQMQTHTPFVSLMGAQDFRDHYRDLLADASGIMAGDLLSCLDSVRNAIRADVYLDPHRQGTPEDFEQACDSLRWFIASRASLLPAMYVHHSTPEETYITVDPQWVTPGTDRITVRAFSSDTLQYCNLFVIPDGQQPVMLRMRQVNSPEGAFWMVNIRDQVEFTKSIRFFIEFRQASVPWPEPVMYHPVHSLFDMQYNSEAFPSAVRVTRAPDPDALRPGVLLRLGPSLWAMPLVNESSHEMDLSLCAVTLGHPSAPVYLPENLTLSAGETLFVTNDLSAFLLELPGRKAAGDCTAEQPLASDVAFLDPGWVQQVQYAPPFGERHLRPLNEVPVVTEISYSQPAYFQSRDWLELHNPGSGCLDLSRTGITGSGTGHTVFPHGTVIPPFGFLVMASDVDLFNAHYPGVRCQVMELGFSLSSDGEDLRFVNRGGFSTTLAGYSGSHPWPESASGIIAVRGAGLDPNCPESWEAVDQPGTPGSGNPSWFQSEGGRVTIASLRPNPSTGREILFTLAGGQGPVNALLMDLSGRMVLDRGILEPGLPEYTLELPSRLPSGVYFLVVRSAGSASTRKLIWLP